MTKPLLMKPGELRKALGLGATKFWELKRAGSFDCLFSPIAGYYSRPLVERWIDGTLQPVGAALAGRKHLNRGRAGKENA